MSLKYCFKCSEPVEQVEMVCPACGAESFVHKRTRAELNGEVQGKTAIETQGHESAFKNFKVGSSSNLQRIKETNEPNGYRSGSYDIQAQKAALESSKNALTFRNIGVVLQWMGLLFASFTYAVVYHRYLVINRPLAHVFAIGGATVTFFIFWISGALYRGLASYIRFKALAYLAEKDK